ncbi:MAG: peptidylprolyl isomerase [Planctomycetota bacterium]|jgi:hypothetical protein
MRKEDSGVAPGPGARTAYGLRDPLVLFLLLGCGLAALHFATRDDAPRLQRDTLIVVTDGDIRWLTQVFERTWSRPPTPEEVRALVDRRVRDEILYREALALGLDQGDAALRRRIAMKLEYLARDAGGLVEPTDAELEVYLAAHTERYAEAPRRAFTQVYVRGDDTDPAASEARARRLLDRLRAEPDVDPDTVGDGFLIDRRQPPMTPAEVARLFGEGFAEALLALSGDGWQGPIRSGYGLHLVRIDAEMPGGPQTLEVVRDRVREDLLDGRREAALEAYLEALRAKYEVEIRASLPGAGS